MNMDRPDLWFLLFMLFLIGFGVPLTKETKHKIYLMVSNITKQNQEYDIIYKYILNQSTIVKYIKSKTQNDV